MKPLYHFLLFLFTFLTTTLAGAEWSHGKVLFITGLTTAEILNGFHYSVPFLLILSVHEFGHYLTARYHDLKVTLPYYIPLYLGFSISIGTLGAIIRIKSIFDSRRQFFDVGVAGPVAGFIIAVGVTIYGFLNLPPPEHIFTIHPEYAQYGLDYAAHVYENQPVTLKLGTNLLFEICKYFLVEDKTLIPNSFEIMHYPYLLAGYLGCFFTALNLIPVGQLDGGHILYGLFGKGKYYNWSKSFYLAFLTMAGLGLFSAQNIENSLFGVSLYLVFLWLCTSKIYPKFNQTVLAIVLIFTVQFVLKSFFNVNGFTGWLLFAFILGRLIGIEHPIPADDRPLDLKRKLLAWFSIIIFILCFSPYPFSIQ